MTHVSVSPTITTTRIRPDTITDNFLAPLRQHGMVKAALFGSILRGEARLDSDVDLYVAFN
jgi:predicted nucleotidyltransferase